MKKWKTTDIRKDFNEKNKPVVISDNDSKEKGNGFECQYCHRIIYTKFTDDSIWCNSCNAETIFEKDTKPVKKRLRTETMDTNEVYVKSIDTNVNDMVEKTKWNRPLELSGAYKRMSDRGIHFTSYSETLPESGQTYSWSQSSGSTSSLNSNTGRKVPGPLRMNREEGDNDTTTE
jgi:hypothetical protein